MNIVEIKESNGIKHGFICEYSETENAVLKYISMENKYKLYKKFESIEEMRAYRDSMKGKEISIIKCIFRGGDAFEFEFTGNESIYNSQFGITVTPDR